MKLERKVLFTASTFSHIRNFHLPYLAWFRDRGWEVHAACGGEQAHIPQADRVIALPFEKRMASPQNFRAAAILRDLIRREGYALISTHTSLAAFFTRLAVKGMRDRPKVADIVHGYLFDDDTPALKRGLLLAAERLTAPETDLLLTMNDWDFQCAQKRRLGRRVERIPGMGVDFAPLDRGGPEAGRALRRELGLPEDAFLLLYPAEFSRRKSQRVLIEAMPMLPENCVLALPGQGALLEECRDLAGALGLARRIIFPGQAADMAPWFAAAGAAVSASRGEGLPFNVMEAMHRGLPVAASRVKGHTDLIEDGTTGLLYPYGDAAACAAAVRALLELPDRGREMGRRGAERAERFRLDRVLPEVAGLYGQLMPPG